MSGCTSVRSLASYLSITFNTHCSNIYIHRLSPCLFSYPTTSSVTILMTLVSSPSWTSKYELDRRLSVRVDPLSYGIRYY